MRIGVLGPVVVWRGGDAMPVGGVRERYVLAVLLLNADRVTPAERLIGALWVKPPRSARAQLHNLVSRLRGKVGDGVIVTRPTGYQLTTRAVEVDLVEFRALAERGRRAAEVGEHAVAEEAFGAAVALWRGPALADVDEEHAGVIRAALHEERLAAQEGRLAARLALGRYDEVLAEVVPLVVEHPYRERLYETRMVALVAVGRQAEALEVYREAYRKLDDDLGVTPGAALRELEQRILRGEVPALRRVVPVVVPRQLPPEMVALAGRGKSHAEIVAALRADGPGVAVLVGPGGVGKTALAVAVAHHVVERFPDGQLFATLRGSHRDRIDPHVVVGRFLRALGVDGAAVPEDPEERVALYRSTLADRAVLVVLDDVATEAQVRPLLPGGSSCATVVTSRHQLGALVGAARWTVPALAAEDSLELLSRVAGAERIAAEPEAAGGIAALCGNLPLAISVAAGRLAVHPTWRVADFRDRLAEERRRLDELSLGDLDVRAVIATSYRLLDPPARLLLRRLGLSATPEWPAWVAGALVGGDVDRPLETLADVHLVEVLGRDRVGQERYRLHGLVHDFAAERAADEEPPEERDAALGRVLSGWLGRAGVADERLGHGLQGAVGLGLPLAPDDVAGPIAAAPREWFEVELGALSACVEQAVRLGLAEVAGGLALRMVGFLALRTYDVERERILRAAVASTRAHGVDRQSVRLLLSLFGLAAQRARFEELPALAAEGLAVARKLGDAHGIVGALGNAGWAAQGVGRLAEAARWYEEAVDACDAGTPTALARWMALSLARTRHEAGFSAQAVPVVERLLADPDEVARNRAQLLVLGADVLLAVGRDGEAERWLTEAAGLLGDLGDELGSARVGHDLARVWLHRGEWDRAAERLDRVLRAHEEFGVRDEVARTLGTVGELELRRGGPAADALRRSLAIWREVGARLDVARTLARLAFADPDGAAAHRRECAGILDELGLDDRALRLPSDLHRARMPPG
ncbi:AfsR/SARP family transcriptional regulator [Saccharothrix sp. NRRL B-16348]|uniref:AfsR/SARP family transcriptional regulator n=1 Tax=Saccharothrix sp. NRRL B-16348 TaxID=1415542 RepID=UPI0018D06F68|nr:AfsR/SARP family transcriptional regulator [Saccharothrix sp. NRRL B-16348]